MKKLLLIATGGTIAASQSEKGLTPTLDAKQLLSHLSTQLHQRYQIDCQQLMSIDSAEMTPADWAKIAKAVYQLINDYDGIVISHGTDTMAYTAAALSYMLPGLNKPLVLTGSQRPLVAADSDAPGNLEASFYVAASDLFGVMVVFANRIIDGRHAYKFHISADDAFISVGAKEIGQVKDGELIINQPPQPIADKLRLNINYDQRIVLIRLFPGISEQAILTAAVGTRAVIITAYGAGNIPPVAAMAIKKLQEQNIKIVLHSYCIDGDMNAELYASGAASLGVEVSDLPGPAIVAKMICQP